MTSFGMSKQRRIPKSSEWVSIEMNFCSRKRYESASPTLLSWRWKFMGKLFTAWESKKKAFINSRHDGWSRKTILFPRAFFRILRIDKNVKRENFRCESLGMEFIYGMRAHVLILLMCWWGFVEQSLEMMLSYTVWWITQMFPNKSIKTQHFLVGFHCEHNT